MVKNVGFICEGECEKIIIESPAFQHFLAELKLKCVKTIDAAGNGNLLPKNLSNHIETMIRNEAETIIVFTDLDEDVCITLTKNRINFLQNKIEIVISVKAIESWFLADSGTLSTIFQKQYEFPNPESTTGKPIDTLREQFILHRAKGRGFGDSKPHLAKLMLKNGFSILNSAKHPNCPSAKYFVDKLRRLSLKNQ